jgi:PAS domain S-box-containing protein
VKYLGVKFAIVLTIAMLNSFAGNDKDYKILVVHSYSPGLVWTRNINEGMKEIISSHLENYAMVEEYLDSKRLFDEQYEKILFELFQHKYRKTDFDVVLVSDDDALRFMRKFGEELFPTVPVVFCGINVYDPEEFRNYPHFTGVLEQVEMQATLDLALQLFPETQNVYLFGDNSTSAGDLAHFFKELIIPNYPNLNFDIYQDSNIERLLPQIEAIPTDSSVVILLPMVSLEGRKVMEFEASSQYISRNTEAPVFGLWSFTLGQGVIGGKMVSGRQQGRKAAEIALEILSGRDARNIDIIDRTFNQYYFDYNLLKTYHIDHSELPDNSIILFQPVSFVEKYNDLLQSILITMGVLLGIFLIYLLYNRKVKKVIQEELRFQQRMINALPNPVLYTEENGLVKGCNDAFEKLTGLARHEITGKTISGIYPPEQRKYHEIANKEVELLQTPKIFEGQIKGSNNEIREVIFYKSPVKSINTDKNGIIESIIDITEKKTANELIRQSEERYSFVTLATMDGIWDWNFETKNYYSSERLKEILGFQTQENPFRPDRLHLVISPKDLQMVQHQLQLVKEKVKEAFDIEVRMLHNNGTFIWTNLQVFGITNSSNEVIRLVGTVSDISMKKDAEFQMKKWEDIFRNTRMGIAITSIDKIRLDLLNPVLAHMHQYEPSELRGKPLETLFAPEHRSTLREEIAKSLTQSHHVFESVHMRRNGSFFPVMIDITSVKDKNDTPLYLIINIQDITIRKEQEQEIAQMLQNEQSINEELRANQEELKHMLEQTVKLKEKIEQSQKQYEHFINGTRDFAILKDNDLRFIQVNKAFADFFGKKPKDFVGKREIDFIPEQQAHEIEQIDKRILNTQETIIYENDHKGQYYEVRKFPVYYEKDKTGIGAFIRNITTQKMIEQQLQKNELRFKTMLENTYDAITLIDSEGIITYCTDVIEKITGMSAAGLIGKNIRQLVHSEDRVAFTARLKQVFNSPGLPVSIQFRSKSDTKEFRYIESIAVNHINNPLIGGVLITSRDVSVEHQSMELKKNIALAQKSAEIKQQFLSNMSHEIRTPMNGIVGMIEFLMKTNLNPQQKDYVETIRDSADSLLNIINDILDFSKIEAGKMTINPTNVNIRKFTSNIRKLFLALAKQKQLDFQIEIDNQIPAYVLVDSVRLNQVISNLLSNAIKFTPQGTVILRIINQELINNTLSLKFEVHDTGIGINPEDQKKLFSSFFQIDSSLTRTREGTGLGLAISHNIVELMGGKLNVESKPGMGSTFWFTIKVPVVTSQTESLEEAMKLKKEPGKLNLKILLVEDKLVNQKVIKLMLESLGCKVSIANNGKEAIEIIQNYEKSNKNGTPCFDIILMDIQMPVMDGITATKIIRDTFPTYKRIIGLSANAMASDIDNFLGSGLDDYIIKPAKTDTIYQKLHKWSAQEIPVDSMIDNQEQYINQIKVADENIVGLIASQAENNPLVLDEFYASMEHDASILINSIGRHYRHNDEESMVASLDQLNNMAVSMGATQLQKTIEIIRQSNYDKTVMHPGMLTSLNEALKRYFQQARKLY